MTSTSLIIAAKILHVLSSTAWAGFVIVAGLALVSAAGSAEGRERRHVRRRAINRAALVVAPAAVMSLFSGLYLFAALHAGLDTPAEFALKIGAACAVLSFFVGALGSGGAEQRLSRLDDAGHSSLEQVREIHALNRRVMFVGRITAALLMLSGATMAAARFL